MTTLNWPTTHKRPKIRQFELKQTDSISASKPQNKIKTHKNRWRRDLHLVCHVASPQRLKILHLVCLNMHQLRRSYTMFPSAEDVALRESTRKIKTTDKIGCICIFHLKLGYVAAYWELICIGCQLSYFSFPPRWHWCLSYQIWCNWQVFSCKEDICLPSPCQAEWRQTPAHPFTSD